MEEIMNIEDEKKSMISNGINDLLLQFGIVADRIVVEPEKDRDGYWRWFVEKKNGNMTGVVHFTYHSGGLMIQLASSISIALHPMGSLIAVFMNAYETETEKFKDQPGRNSIMEILLRKTLDGAIEKKIPRGRIRKFLIDQMHLDMNIAEKYSEKKGK